MPTNTMSLDHRILQFEAWLRNSDRAPLTLSAYLSDLKQFGAWHATTFGAEPDIVTSLHGQAWRKALQEEHRSVSTINRRVAALRVFCAWQHERGITEQDEGARVKGLKSMPAPAPAVLSHAEVLRLFHAAEGNPRDYAIIQLFVQAGLRLEELARLRPGDVEMGERSGKVTVLGKGNKTRTVAVNVTAREALRAWLVVRPQDAGETLFISRKRRGLSRRAIQGLVERYGKAAGLENLHCHALRHAFATNLLAAGGNNLALVQQALGHESILTTRRYVGLTEAQMQDAAEKNKSNVMGEDG